MGTENQKNYLTKQKIEHTINLQTTFIWKWFVELNLLALKWCNIYFFPTVNGNKESTKAANTAFTQISTPDLYDQGTVIHTTVESSSQPQGLAPARKKKWS